VYYPVHKTLEAYGRAVFVKNIADYLEGSRSVVIRCNTPPRGIGGRLPIP